MLGSTHRTLLLLICLYAAASGVHFVHNAEFLGAYPGLPTSWTRSGVYCAWMGVTLIGGLGVLLIYRGRELLGLSMLAVYAVLGLDSLGHYAVAPLSAHTAMMNSTILLEVAAAGLVLLEVARRFYNVATGRTRKPVG